MLHEAHVGIVKMKSFARRYVYWPNIDKDIEHLVKTCDTCQSSQPSPGPAPLHPWEYPSSPWSRVHVDYAGPLPGNKMILIIIDAHSKWIDAHVTEVATSAATIGKLMQTFATHGLPDTLVSDNGSCFTSTEFANFMSSNGIRHVKVAPHHPSSNGIRHVKVAPHHPSSNGLAEKAVGIVKSGLGRNKQGTLNNRLARVLFKYRETQQTTTEETPAKLLVGRQLKTPLDNLRPNLCTKVEMKQRAQKQNHDRRAINRSFTVGDLVYSMNYANGKRWMPGLVVEQTGPLSFVVELIRGGLVRRHQDQFRRRYSDGPQTPDTTVVEPPSFSAQMTSTHTMTTPTLESNASSVAEPDIEALDSPKCQLSDSKSVPANEEVNLEVQPQAAPLRRSARVSRPPARLDL